MRNFVLYLQDILPKSINFYPKQVLDILLVTYIIFRLLKLVHGTRAWRILGGILIFVCALFASDKLELYTLHWVLDKATILAPFAIVILLLPEVRTTLEELYKLGAWPQKFLQKKYSTTEHTIDQISEAFQEMSSTKTGALVVLVKNNPLEYLTPSGTTLNAAVSKELLLAIFYHGNPLHDGATIIDGNKIVAAECTLPLSETTQLAKTFHTRHRAALGISEQSDSVAIVVSEERGTISWFESGKHVKIKNKDHLKELLISNFLIVNNSNAKKFTPRIKIKR